jgi:hypothetical protein
MRNNEPDHFSIRVELKVESSAKRSRAWLRFALPGALIAGLAFSGAGSASAAPSIKATFKIENRTDVLLDDSLCEHVGGDWRH